MKPLFLLHAPHPFLILHRLIALHNKIMQQAPNNNHMRQILKTLPLPFPRSHEKSPRCTEPLKRVLRSPPTNACAIKHSFQPSILILANLKQLGRELQLKPTTTFSELVRSTKRCPRSSARVGPLEGEEGGTSLGQGDLEAACDVDEVEEQRAQSGVRWGKEWEKRARKWEKEGLDMQKALSHGESEARQKQRNQESRCGEERGRGGVGNG